MDSDRSAWRHHDVIQTPSGDLFVAEYSRYSKAVEWTQLLPTGFTVTDLPDSRAVLLSRVVDGRPLPVTDIGAGDLFAVDVLRPRIVRPAETGDPPEYDREADLDPDAA